MFPERNLRRSFSQAVLPNLVIQGELHIQLFISTLRLTDLTLSV